MKISSVVALCALVASPVFARDVSTSNTFGTMKVTCNAKKVMICTPWVECATGDDVKVDNLVMTAGLSDGDAILIYSGNKTFKCWTLQSTDGVLSWVAGTVTDEDGTIETGDANSSPIARGKGFWFVKKSYTDNTPYDLYLYGQVAADTADTSTINAGAYNLLANPLTKEVDIKDKITGAAKGDSIQLAGNKFYRYNGTKWTTTKKEQLNSSNRYVITTVDATSITIPMGTGFWYVSTGSTAGSITWN